MKGLLLKLANMINTYYGMYYLGLNSKIMVYGEEGMITHISLERDHSEKTVIKIECRN